MFSQWVMQLSNVFHDCQTLVKFEINGSGCKRIVWLIKLSDLVGSVLKPHIMNAFKRIGITFSVLKLAKRSLADYAGFAKILEGSENIVALTGAGVSTESGIDTFRGPAGIWKRHSASSLATPSAFRSNPSLVWEFYHWRRENAFKANPNHAHLALAKFEKLCKEHGRNFTVLTQNVDGLHKRAGSENILELHGSLAKVICTKCKSIEVNTDSPICEALRGRGDPNGKEYNVPIITVHDLPKCKKCNALVRPYIVWYGESLDPVILHKTRNLVETCDLFLVIGTSSTVHPAASFANFVIERGKPVAEFNIEPEAASDKYQFYFAGKCGTTLPKALGVE